MGNTENRELWEIPWHYTINSSSTFSWEPSICIEFTATEDDEYHSVAYILRNIPFLDSKHASQSPVWPSSFPSMPQLLFTNRINGSLGTYSWAVQDTPLSICSHPFLHFQAADTPFSVSSFLVSFLSLESFQCSFSESSAAPSYFSGGVRIWSN